MKPERERDILRKLSIVLVTAFALNSVAGAGIMIAERDEGNRLDVQLSSLLPSVNALDLAGKKTENVGGDIDSVRKELALEEQKVAHEIKEPSHKGITVFGIGAGLSILLALAIGIRKRQINTNDASTPSSS